jgi:hypothetical protein
MKTLKLTLVWLGQLCLDLRCQAGIDFVCLVFALLPGLRCA